MDNLSAFEIFVNCIALMLGTIVISAIWEITKNQIEPLSSWPSVTWGVGIVVFLIEIHFGLRDPHLAGLYAASAAVGALAWAEFLKLMAPD